MVFRDKNMLENSNCRIAGEKKTRKTLIHSALLRGTEPLNCGRLISPKANA